MDLSKIRRFLFWNLDSLKGSPIQKHVKEISFCLDNLTRINGDDMKNHHLISILRHAISTTPFYKKHEHYSSILDFPIINKKNIQDEFENFQSSSFKNQSNFKAITSGSTGVPFFIYQNKNKRDRNHADLIYFYNLAHYNVGDKLYKLEVIKKYNTKARLMAWMQNVIQFDVAVFSKKRVNFFFNILNSHKNANKTILGFASALEAIAQYLEQNNIYFNDLGINSAIAYGEYLSPYIKTIFQKHLNTMVLSRYSSHELGVVAQQTFESPNSFIINHASYYVEVLHLENDKQVQLGEFGRIIVTDLFNYATPLIRYDTGDIGKLNVNNKGIMVLEQIEGRKMDLIYDAKGDLISSFVVHTIFYKYYIHIKQYQFIQQGKYNYEIKLNILGEKFHFEKELIDDIKFDFGEDAEVMISYVNEIPKLASGKRKMVINNFKA